MTITKHLDKGMSSIPQLQGTCNTLELRLTALLQSLQVSLNGDGSRVTVAVFETNNANRNNVGKLSLSEGGTNTALIQNESKNILIGRT